MEHIYTSKEDILEIYKDGDKYFLKYPTFNITMPEIVKEIPKTAVDGYLSGEHTGKELISYASNGIWKLKHHLTQEESDRKFLREHPKFILNNIEENRKLFSEEEFQNLLSQAHKISKFKGD
ncbi:Uncharacterised protein [Streptococcus gallolyticus]|uniref:Uncharacterized protein n=1 Tax=Streptococcus gallolyticus TaxID=315405 RepID=A0AA94M3M3_9STRE|nr:hypothetical protein [Streptococcus gallolyticus]AQP43050.1 hypothetical protein BTR42_10410 [Streptococcus gallolyticus subsp. gallolyticus DSM 16831]SQG80352.1 Uncharacterised protein [Streptococcus gallolyticus]